MKKHLLLLYILLFGTLCANGQNTEVSSTLPVDPATNKVTFAKIVDAPGISSGDLFENARKFIATKSTKSNPYTISYENKQEGSLVAEGTFTLPAERKKYMVRFSMTIGTKEGKYRYTLTNIIVLYHTAATSSSGGYGYWANSSHTEAETLEYSLETFYPSRLKSRKPVIKYFEEINEESFIAIHRELKSLTSSFRRSMGVAKDNW